MKVLALDHGSARTGVAVSDPTGTIARPLPAIARVDSPAGRRALDAVIAERGARARSWWASRASCPASAAPRRGRRPASRARLRGARQSVPVELWDERLTTVEAQRRGREGGSRADLDSLAACVLLEAYLAARVVSRRATRDAPLPPRAPAGGGGGRTVLWLVLIVVMAAAVGLALARDAFTGDDAAAGGRRDDGPGAATC